MTRAELIRVAAEDAVLDLLTYDRKHDEELRPGDIEDAIHDGDVTVEELAELFAACLRDGISRT
jgi:hypothetical protein